LENFINIREIAANRLANQAGFNRQQSLIHKHRQPKLGKITKYFCKQAFAISAPFVL